MRRRITSLRRLAAVLERPLAGIEQVPARLPLAITPYYASLIRQPDHDDPIFAQVVPQRAELRRFPHLFDDPLAEDEHMPVPGLVHRYPDRALLLATSTCASYCRHCNRQRVAGQRRAALSPARLQQVVAYLQEHPQVRDVIVSGGDPLTMSNARLESILAALRGVASVEILRLGTRVPVTLPMRITGKLVAMLRRYRPLWINTQFNHPREMTDLAAAACARLVDAGIPLGNQTVLLRGINDDPLLMERLCRTLVRHRVRPYYLFQCDLVQGVEHFRTPLARGLQILEHLRGRLGGLAIPTLAVDAAGGGGKIPLLPDYLVSREADRTLLRNWQGRLVEYPEPRE